MINITQHLKVTSSLNCIIAIVFALWPLNTAAHVQWFVAPEEMKNVTFGNDDIYTLLTALIILFSTFAVLVTRYSQILPGVDKLTSHRFFIRRQHYVRFFTLLTVLFFLLLLLRGGFIAPNINLPTESIPFGVIIQSLIVLSAIVSISLSGIFVLIATLFMVINIPWGISVNYVFEFVAVGIFMLLTGHHVSTLDNRLVVKYQLDSSSLWTAAVDILRVGLGLQLVVLAYTEKIAYPGLALVFVEMFPFYNFFPTIGLPTATDLHFVWFVGLCELALGLLLVFGLANRLVMIMLTFAFTTTALIHGAHEIEGHLPIFAAAGVLLLELRNRYRPHLNRTKTLKYS